MWFDKLLDRKAPGLRGLLLVVVLALMGAVLVVQGAQHWRAGERSAERSRLLQQTADTLQAQTTGGSMLGAVSLMGLSEPLLKDMALGRLPPDHPRSPVPPGRGAGALSGAGRVCHVGRRHCGVPLVAGRTVYGLEPRVSPLFPAGHPGRDQRVCGHW